jgi:hypothetical protein
MNPEKMRSEYGKLVLLMQDALTPEIQSLLGVNIYKPIRTVFGLLEGKRGLRVLQDPRLGVASQEVYPEKGKSQAALQQEIRRKETAAKAIVKDHVVRGRLSEDDIRLCLYSICDNSSFLNSNCRPIDECIQLLNKHFRPNIAEPGSCITFLPLRSLAVNVARILASHRRGQAGLPPVPLARAAV